MTRTRTALVVLAAPLAAVTVGACSLLTPSLTEKQLEDEIKSTVTSQTQVNPDSVDCPGPLKGEVGTSETCDITANGKTIKIKVTVTSVEGKTIKFDINEA